MKFLRKSSLITVTFLGAWLCASSSFSMEMEYSCCLKYKCQCECTEESHTGHLSFSSEYLSGSGHCHCSLCKDHHTKETLFSRIDITTSEKKQVLTLAQDIREGKIPLAKEDSTAYPDNKSTFKLFPLFLLKSSFLL